MQPDKISLGKPDASRCLLLDQASEGARAMVRAPCKLWIFLGIPPVIIATIKTPPASKKEQKLPRSLWDLLTTITKYLGRQLVCLQLSFSSVLWAVRVGTSWDASLVFDRL